jgi:hypothetical protein
MPKYGDPFYVAVVEGNLDGKITSCDVMTSEMDYEDALIAGIRDDVQEFGAANHLYICVPIGRIWARDYDPANWDESKHDYDVVVDVAKTEIERMARAAIAMGVDNAERRSTNA